MMRLPSHGIRLGSPPKLHGQATTQLQLSATVAESCHDGVCARDGTVRNTRDSAATAANVRIYENLLNGSESVAHCQHAVNRQPGLRCAACAAPHACQLRSCSPGCRSAS